MVQAKEGAHAFMPTSNDSIHVNGTTSSYSPSLSPTPRRNPTGHSLWQSDSLVYTSPSRCDASDELVSPTDMSALPRRQQVTSASPLPVSEFHPPSDDTFWNTQYNRVVEIHETERRLWNDEKQFLERQIAWLKEEARKQRNGSGVSFFGGKENDKVFAGPEIIRHSQEKLRQFSNVSALKEQTSTGGLSTSQTNQDVPMGEEYVGQRQPSLTVATGSRLSSITEGDTNLQDQRLVSINANGTTVRHAPTIESLNENPASAATIAQIPTPPNARTYAGRTPPVPRASSGTLEEDNDYFTRSYSGAGAYDCLDDDPELDSPKMLPNSPSNANAPALTDLTKKLENIASDPANSIPEVVRSASVSPLPPTNATGQGEEVVGIKLKAKPSMNFGAPLGNLWRS